MKHLNIIVWIIGYGLMTNAQETNRQLRVWAFGDAHVGTDARHKRESLAGALQQSERSFAWDIAIDVGDNSGGQAVPDDAEGREIVRQFAVLVGHRREQILLKDTTTATGEWEGMIKDREGRWQSGYHGNKPQGTPQGASYLYWVGGVPDAQAFEKFLAERQASDAPPGSNIIALWLGGHTHPINPDDTHGGKPLIATKWGVHFINVCPLTKYHVNRGHPTTPLSRLLTFTEGSDKVLVQCWLHTADHAPLGWYNKAERVLQLPRPFRQ